MIVFNKYRGGDVTFKIFLSMNKLGHRGSWVLIGPCIIREFINKHTIFITSLEKSGRN